MVLRRAETGEEEQKEASHFMSIFHVKDTFELPDRKLFVLAGAVVEGEIRAGMFVRVTLNSAVELTARIYAIEFARRQGSEDICLCFKLEPEALELWRGLGISDNVLEITQDGLV